MSENEQNTPSNDDFEALLNNFINSELPTEDSTQKQSETSSESTEQQSSDTDVQVVDLSPEDLQENEDLSQAFEQELADTFSEAREAVEQNESAVKNLNSLKLLSTIKHPLTNWQKHI